MPESEAAAEQAVPLDAAAAIERIARAADPRPAIVDAIATAHEAAREHEQAAHRQTQRVRAYRAERDDARAHAEAYEQVLYDHGIPIPDVRTPRTRAATTASTPPGGSDCTPPERSREALLRLLGVESEQPTAPAPTPIECREPETRQPRRWFARRRTG
ncbi:MAG: hypothetical protein ACTH0V_00370 [Microbacteriaceae bacterium]